MSASDKPARAPAEADNPVQGLLEGLLQDLAGRMQSSTALSRETLENIKALDHFRAIVESSEDAVISKTLNGIVSSWNQGAQTLFGYSAAEMIGQPMLRLFPPERANEEAFILEKILEGESVSHFETVRLHKSGRPLQVSVSISPIRDNLGRIVGASKIARDIGRQKQLEAQAQQLSAIVQNSEDAIMGESLDGLITSWNPSAERIFGYRAIDMVGQSMMRLVPPERAAEERAVLDKIRRGESVQVLETERLRQDGQAIAVSLTTSPIRDTQGRLCGASRMARDISAQQAALKQLRLAASVFTNTAEGIAITDRRGRIVDVNAAFSCITGYAREEVLGQSGDLFRSSRQGPEVISAMRRAVYAKGQWKGEIWSRRKDGQSFSAWLTVSRIADGAGRTQHYVALFTDVTVLKLQQEQLERGAHFDALTNLPNRILLTDRLHQAMNQCQREQRSLAVIYMDLDGFKTVNDQYGHEVGDALLVAIASRMRLALREVDTLARIGGDEFVAVMTDMGSVQDSINLAKRILHACSEPISIQGVDLRVSASIGITHYPQDNVAADQLMRHADQAMYEAKQSGKNRFHIFDSAQDAVLRSRSQQQEQLTLALAREELLLHYQPKVNMRTGVILGVEALLRWQHPQKGLLMPDSFLPAIEHHPLIEAIGAWVLRTAMNQISAWAEQGLRLVVGVNIAARQLQQPRFASELGALLTQYPAVQASQLDLEVLETSALHDLAATAATMRDCLQMGVQFAIDDFGTGYSSLTYLRHLPAKTLKIDQSFVRDMLQDQDDLSIVTGVIGLAQAFHREVLAEGVETLAHGSRLLALGCEMAQGYGIARPMAASAVPTWCASWRPAQEWRQTG